MTSGDNDGSDDEFTSIGRSMVQVMMEGEKQVWAELRRLEAPGDRSSLSSLSTVSLPV
jgi:hypothetical protein